MLRRFCVWSVVIVVVLVAFCAQSLIVLVVVVVKGRGVGGHFVSVSVMVVAFCGSLTSLFCSMCVFLLLNVHGGKKAY